MHNIKVIIIEDEKPTARALTRKIEALGYTVFHTLHSVAQSKEWFKNNDEPDLIFMDIQLSDGLSFEIFDDIKINSSIIFTTAYDEFAIQAFKLNSIDYLLKPVMEEELKFALNKYEKNKQVNNNFDIQFLKNMLTKGDEHYKTQFTIKIGQSLKIVETQDIAYFYSENKGTYLGTKDKSNYLLDLNLEQIEQLLHPKTFFRINRGNIINITAIKDIAIHSNSRLKIYLQNHNSDELIVSREKVNDFKEWLD